MRLVLFLISATFLLGITSAFPAYQSLAGCPREEVDLFIREHGESLVGAKPSPPALKDISSKLVHDAKHPYVAPGPNDLRGPCPGLNTLSNHGVSLIFHFDKGPPTYPPIKYLDHSGIVTPQEIVAAVQEGKFTLQLAFDAADIDKQYRLQHGMGIRNVPYLDGFPRRW